MAGPGPVAATPGAPPFMNTRAGSLRIPEEAPLERGTPPARTPGRAVSSRSARFMTRPLFFGRPSLGLPHSVSTSSTNMNPRLAKIAANSMCGRLPQQNARNPRLLLNLSASLEHFPQRVEHRDVGEIEIDRRDRHLIVAERRDIGPGLGRTGFPDRPDPIIGPAAWIHPLGQIIGDRPLGLMG